VSAHRSGHTPALTENLLAVAEEVVSTPFWVRVLAILVWLAVPCWRAVDDTIHPMVDYGLLSALSFPGEVLLISWVALLLARTER
jgi:hypothetical protein